MKLLGDPAALPTSARPRRAVFIDKDGTLVEDVPYNVDPSLLRFTPKAVAALRRLQEAGFVLIVVSNQPGLALGRFDLTALKRLANALLDRLGDEGVQLNGFYVCPHAPAGSLGQSVSRPGRRISRNGCHCRKPSPGLLRQAARDHAIDLAASWMVGDILDDIEAGCRAGCRSVHLDRGNETVWRRSPIRVPTFTAPDLLDAAEGILTALPSPRSGVARDTRRHTADRSDLAVQ